MANRPEQIKYRKIIGKHSGCFWYDCRKTGNPVHRERCCYEASMEIF